MGAARDTANRVMAGARNRYGAPRDTRRPEPLAVLITGVRSVRDGEAGALEVVDGRLLHGGEGIGERVLRAALGRLAEVVVVGVVGDVDVRAVGERLHGLRGVRRDLVEVLLVGEERRRLR